MVTNAERRRLRRPVIIAASIDLTARSSHAAGLLLLTLMRSGSSRSYPASLKLPESAESEPSRWSGVMGNSPSEHACCCTHPAVRVSESLETARCFAFAGKATTAGAHTAQTRILPSQCRGNPRHQRVAAFTAPSACGRTANRPPTPKSTNWENGAFSSVLIAAIVVHVRIPASAESHPKYPQRHTTSKTSAYRSDRPGSRAGTSPRQPPHATHRRRSTRATGDTCPTETKPLPKSDGQSYGAHHLVSLLHGGQPSPMSRRSSATLSRGHPEHLQSHGR